MMGQAAAGGGGGSSKQEKPHEKQESLEQSSASVLSSGGTSNSSRIVLPNSSISITSPTLSFKNLLTLSLQILQNLENELKEYVNDGRDGGGKEKEEEGEHQQQEISRIGKGERTSLEEALEKRMTMEVEVAFKSGGK